MKQNEFMQTLTSATSNSLTPAIATHLVKELMKHEKGIGGPYLPPYSLEDQLIVNFHAVRLFGGDTPLHGAETFLKNHSYAPPVETTTPTAPRSHENTELYRKAHSVITSALGEHAQPALKMLKIIQETDNSGEISNLSTAFSDTLSGDDANWEQAKQHDLANILTWVAYSIYDSAYDDSRAEINTIPIANILSRLSLSLFSDADTPLAHGVFAQTDLAHATEIATCRFDPASTPPADTIPPTVLLERLLSGRSIAHCAGPLILGQNTSALKSSLEDYCAARQLLDDIHDWKDDFTSGKWTYVTSHLARKVQLKVAAPATESLTQMEHLFWETEAEYLLNHCELLITRSKQHEAFNTKSFYARTLRRLEASIIVSRKSIRDARLFTQLVAKQSFPR